jgi:DNA-binding transcriptional LysR family regulator
MAGYTSHNLEAFVDVVRLKSFSAAARRRDLTPSSVARQVSSLEEELGVKLLIRSTRSVTLTEAGCILFERSRQILEEMEDAKRAATLLRDDVRGNVRLACWPTFAKCCVLPHLPSLLEQYPELRVDLDLTERLHEPVLSRTDLVIRIGPLSNSNLLSTSLGSQSSVVVACPAYLERYGAPRTLEECAKHRLIDKRHGTELMGWRALLGEGRAVTRQRVLQTDDLEAQAEACVEGVGLLFIPSWAVKGRISTGALIKVKISLIEERSKAEVHLLRNPGTPTATIRAFSDFLRSKVRLSLE